MGVVGPCFVKVSWLGGLVPVFWWMEPDYVSLKDSAISSSVFGLSMSLVWLWSCLSANGQGCAPVLLKDWCGGIWH